jgi:hypothetical protein
LTGEPYLSVRSKLTLRNPLFNEVKMSKDLSRDEQANTLKKTEREGKEWLERLMRFGFVAKGVIYITIGLLAFRAAIGPGGQTTGSEGAIVEISQQPFGQILLALVAIGLLGLTLWYFARGVWDTENKGNDFKGLWKRASAIGSGIGYGLLALFAFQILLGTGGGGGSSSAEWTARLMEQPWGRWLVGIVGLGVIGAGLAQFYHAYRAKFKEKLRSHEMSETEYTWGIRAGQFGIAARGVVIVIIGLFLVQAAVQYDPQEAGGLREALQTLAQQPYGPWALGIVALGLIAYGLFAAIVLAKYRRISL